MRKAIGQTLRNRREEYGLSLRDLAVISNIGHSWLGKVENGRINFQIDSLTKVLECLDLQPSELFNFDLSFDDEGF